MPCILLVIVVHWPIVGSALQLCKQGGHRFALLVLLESLQEGFNPLGTGGIANWSRASLRPLRKIMKLIVSAHVADMQR